MATNHEDTGATLRSAQECERLGASLRTTLGCADLDALPPIMTVLHELRERIAELSELSLTVRSAWEIEGREGVANPDSRDIEISEDDIDDVLADAPEMRFTILHELAHVLHHTGQGKFYRMTNGNVTYSFLKDEKRVEWQADRIARAALISPAMLERAKNAHELAHMSRVPLKQAVLRMQEWKAERPKASPLEAKLAQLQLSANSASGAEKEKFKAEEKKLTLWHGLSTIPGEDPAAARNCDNYWINWDEFGKATDCGWFIENDKIVSFFAMRHR